MLNKTFLLIFVISLFILGDSFAQRLIYSSPKDKSILNMENTTIIMGFETHNNHPENIRLKIIGSVSGYHKGQVKILENNPTKISFKPEKPFKLGEKVTVSGYNHSDKFIFYIRENGINTKDILTQMLNKETSSIKPVYNPYSYSSKLLDTLPSIQINQYGLTAPGNIFIVNFDNVSAAIVSYLMILNDNGSTKAYKRLRFRGLDFKRQNNKYIYWDEDYYQYKALDSGMNMIDSFYTGNGYVTDFHECVLEPDNSAWLMSYDPQVVDMSLIVPGGKQFATVVGLIIQKINADKEVTFQWRSWDHMQITDATHEDLTAYQIDYVHGNSIEVDRDENILISSRHLDEVTKINTQTGDIIWRLGGKNNQFDFVNDTAKFSHQHSARVLPNGNLFLFDNGNFHTPKYSRAVEYKMYESEGKVNKVWEYRSTPDKYSFAMGNVQRLSNGNTLIGWGSNVTTLSEVSSNKNLLYSLSLPSGQWSYRAFRYNTLDVLTNNSNNAEFINDYKLSQNYPNPFNPVTNIEFSIPKAGTVTLKVFDMLGKEIYNYVNDYKSPGTYKVIFNASNLSSGIYFYKIDVNGFTETRRMMLIK